MIARAALAAVVLAASTACAAPLGPASEARRPPTVPLAACRTAGSDTEARCGTHRVFEDRVSRSGRTIPLNILVLPALTASPAGDALFVLAGGPGVGSASGVTRAVVEYFRPMRGERDVVFDECLRDLVSDFVARGSTRDLDVGCVETLRRPPFVAELPPPRTPR